MLLLSNTLTTNAGVYFSIVTAALSATAAAPSTSPSESEPGGERTPEQIKVDARKHWGNLRNVHDAGARFAALSINNLNGSGSDDECGGGGGGEAEVEERTRAAAARCHAKLKKVWPSAARALMRQRRQLQIKTHYSARQQKWVPGSNPL